MSAGSACLYSARKQLLCTSVCRAHQRGTGASPSLKARGSGGSYSCHNRYFPPLAVCLRRMREKSSKLPPSHQPLLPVLHSCSCIREVPLPHHQQRPRWEGYLGQDSQDRVGGMHICHSSAARQLQAGLWRPELPWPKIRTGLDGREERWRALTLTSATSSASSHAAHLVTFSIALAGITSCWILTTTPVVQCK